MEKATRTGKTASRAGPTWDLATRGFRGPSRRAQHPHRNPLVYELEDDLRPIRSYYLGDVEAAEKGAQSVADQLKK